MPYFEDQPNVFDVGGLSEPISRGRICHQIAVGMNEKSEACSFEPESDKKPSGLECARIVEEIPNRVAGDTDALARVS